MALSHDEALLLAFRAELDEQAADHDPSRHDNSNNEEEK